MKKYLNAALHKLTVLLEFIISFVLAAGIIILLVQLILSMPNVPDLNIYPNYEDLVETCFNLIIGVELIRMLYQHKPSTVFEVLLFAIARQVIMAHNNPVSSLIGVISIALLFATRKFLFIEFDELNRKKQKLVLVQVHSSTILVCALPKCITARSVVSK